MIRHILALLAFVATLATFWYLYQVDKEVDAIGKVNEIFRKSDMLVEMGKKSASSGAMMAIEPKDITPTIKEEEDKLKALRDKAGNIGGFEVSTLYRTKCASCHGVNGNGGIGAKIIGLTYEEITKKLSNFKTGVEKNYIMYGLLQNLNDEELDSLAKEISEFANLAKASKK